MPDPKEGMDYSGLLNSICQQLTKKILNIEKKGAPGVTDNRISEIGKFLKQRDVFTYSQFCELESSWLKQQHPNLA